MSSRLLAAVLSLALAGPASAAWVVTDLGAIVPSALNDATDRNGDGTVDPVQVVGSCGGTACLWTECPAGTGGPSCPDDGITTPLQFATATDVNDAGVVVGTEFGGQAVLWRPGVPAPQALEYLGTFTPTAVNDADPVEVLGFTGPAGAFAPTVFWSEGVLQDVGCPDFSCGELYAGAFGALNDNGEVPGLRASQFGFDLVVWSPTGTRTVVATPPFTSTAINNVGQILGYNGFSPFGPAIWTNGAASSFLFQSTPTQQFVGDTSGRPLRINDSGQAIGNEVFCYSSGGVFSCPKTPFVFRDGLATPLPDVNRPGLTLPGILPASSGWTNLSVSDINDAGDVVGHGTFQGTVHGFLLRDSTCTPAQCDDNNPCTVDSCDAGGGCVNTVEADGTSCSQTNACAVCQAGTCTDTDPDVDGVCAADDNCPDLANADQQDLDGDDEGDPCDPDDASLTLEKSNVKEAKADRENGVIKIQGTFWTAPPADVFDVTDGITVRVEDALNLDHVVTWTDCDTTSSGKIKCRSEDRSEQIQINPDRRNPTEHEFKLVLKRLDISADFEAPFALTITTGPPVLVDGIDRVGFIGDDGDECKFSSRGNAVRCKLPR